MAWWVEAGSDTVVDDSSAINFCAGPDYWFCRSEDMGRAFDPHLGSRLYAHLFLHLSRRKFNFTPSVTQGNLFIAQAKASLLQKIPATLCANFQLESSARELAASMTRGDDGRGCLKQTTQVNKY